mgnify:CR=1 FL=1
MYYKKSHDVTVMAFLVIHTYILINMVIVCKRLK